MAITVNDATTAVLVCWLVREILNLPTDKAIRLLVGIAVTAIALVIGGILI